MDLRTLVLRWVGMWISSAFTSSILTSDFYHRLIYFLLKTKPCRKWTGIYTRLVKYFQLRQSSQQISNISIITGPYNCSSLNSKKDLVCVPPPAPARGHWYNHGNTSTFSNYKYCKIASTQYKWPWIGPEQTGPEQARPDRTETTTKLDYYRKFSLGSRGWLWWCGKYWRNGVPSSFSF